MMKTFQKRIGTFFSQTVNKRILTVLCLFWIAFIILPLFLMSFYAYPSHDDFPNATLAINAWAQTGSIWQFIRAAWQQAMYDYNTWQGTFAAMFLCALQPIVFSTSLFWLSPAITLALLCLSAAYLSMQISRYIFKAGKAEATILLAALITVLLFSVPGISELLYWHAAVQYTFSIIVMMALTGLLIKLHFSPKSMSSVLRTAIAALFAFLLGGLPYTHALGGTVGLALISFWALRRKSPAVIPSLMSFAAAVAALFIVVIAPGNAVRQARVGDSMNPIAAIIYSLEACMCGITGWFGLEWIGVAVVLIPLLWPLLQKSSVRFCNPGWFSFFSFGVLAACYVPPIFATGTEGHLLPRIQGSLYMLWGILGLINLIYWTGWTAQRFTLSFKLPTRLWQPVLCAMLVICSAFSTQAVFATPTLGAWKSLITGEAAQYSSEIRSRETALLKAENAQAARNAVQPLSVQPALYPLDLLIYQRETNLPAQMHEFFALQQKIHEYGAGSVPQEAWDELRAWGDRNTSIIP